MSLTGQDSTPDGKAQPHVIMGRRYRWNGWAWGPVHGESVDGTGNEPTNLMSILVQDRRWWWISALLFAFSVFFMWLVIVVIGRFLTLLLFFAPFDGADQTPWLLLICTLPISLLVIEMSAELRRKSIAHRLWIVTTANLVHGALVLALSRSWSWLGLSAVWMLFCSGFGYFTAQPAQHAPDQIANGRSGATLGELQNLICQIKDADLRSLASNVLRYWMQTRKSWFQIEEGYRRDIARVLWLGPFLAVALALVPSWVAQPFGIDEYHTRVGLTIWASLNVVIGWRTARPLEEEESLVPKHIRDLLPSGPWWRLVLWGMFALSVAEYTVVGGGQPLWVLERVTVHVLEQLGLATNDIDAIRGAAHRWFAATPAHLVFQSYSWRQIAAGLLAPYYVSALIARIFGRGIGYLAGISGFGTRQPKIGAATRP
jgi:hypothetical protein